MQSQTHHIPRRFPPINEVIDRGLIDLNAVTGVASQEQRS